MKQRKQHITIHDIARELGISGSTVSRALNNNPRISKSTRDAVQKLAKTHNYLPNALASSLRKGKGNTVGVVVPNINRSFFSNVIGGIEEILSTAGYNLMICQTNEKLDKEKAVLKTLLNARVDGILMSLSMETNDYGHIEDLLDRGVKMVFFDRIPEKLPVHSVVIDDYNVALKVTRHIINQGYNMPAHVGGSSEINVYANRQKGFIQAIKNSGKRLDERYIIETDMTRAGGAAAFEQLMKLRPKPDAVVCSGDLSAHGVLISAMENGLAVPGDLAISGFANEEFTAHIRPSLTSVNQKGNEIGQQAAILFLNGEQKAEKRQIMVEPEIIFRESSKRIS
ncbi:MAG: LacI family DNA-binding transcriptional regulator [Bacteroidales bacterium]